MGFGGGSVGAGEAAPVGTIIMYAGAGAPSGYVACDGASLLVANFGNLFAVIGYQYGGAGANFNVPDFTGERYPRQTVNDAGRGNTGGAKTVTLTAAQSGLPAHSHQQRIMTGGGPVSNLQLFSGQGDNTPIAGNLATTDDAGPSAAASSHNNEPPFIDINFCIKV